MTSDEARREDHPLDAGTTTPSTHHTPRRGPGSMAEPGSSTEWGGRRVRPFTQLVLETYGTTCWLCGFPGANSVDHVIPRSKGGALYDVANAAPAHRRCNYSRGDRDATDAALLVEDGTQFFRN